MGTAFNKNLLFFTPQKRDRWAFEATNLPTYLVRLVLKKLFAGRLVFHHFQSLRAPSLEADRAPRMFRSINSFSFFGLAANGLLANPTLSFINWPVQTAYRRNGVHELVLGPYMAVAAVPPLIRNASMV